MNQPLTMPTDQRRPGGEREAASGLRCRAALRAANKTRRAPIDARGKIAVITGVNAGIGYQSAVAGGACHQQHTVVGDWTWLNSYPMTPQDPSWRRYYSPAAPSGRPFAPIPPRPSPPPGPV
ncbi:hypothetical protein [Micromonospora sp. NPDC049204]|uniref:hypothetical protein n=1 Tax=Micromonospora TaxID=1873 RepID=UPI0033DFD38F